MFPNRVLLHDHMDGSYPLLAVLPELHKLSNLTYRFEGRPNQKQLVMSWFGKPQMDIVERFSLTTGVMQNPDTLSLAVETYTRTRAEQGFIYCEAMIAPQYHVFSGMNEKEVIKYLIEGIKRGEAANPEIEVNILFAIGREVDSEEAVRLVNVAETCDRDYVVGINLACDEGSHPPEKHHEMFRRAREVGLKTSCHAGEWTSKSTDFYADFEGRARNLRTAVLDLKSDRVGHAITLPYDPDLMQYVLDNDIGIEGCPASNLLSGYVPDMTSLQLRKMLEAGVLYSLNVDDDLFLPDLQETFELCNREYNFTQEEIDKMVHNAWSSRFGKRKRAAVGI